MKQINDISKYFFDYLNLKARININYLYFNVFNLLFYFFSVLQKEQIDNNLSINKIHFHSLACKLKCLTFCLTLQKLQFRK
jgi:hypothetical protein